MAWLFASCLAFGSSVDVNCGQAAERPNFLVILADDLGFSDLGCYGGEIQTPNLDRLAAGGLRFTEFYNTARCWPTRACILTGYYAQQVNRDVRPGGKGGGQGKRPGWAPLLPEYLAPLGYRSYHSGKWHVDGPVLAGGFNRSYSLDDHDRYFGPKNHKLDDKPLPEIKPGTPGFYTTTAIANYARGMLDEHARDQKGKPFFLYLAFTAPHFPLHALEEDIALYTNVYSAGWDRLREARHERLRKLDIEKGALPPIEPKAVPSWNLAEPELKKAIGDVEIGRVVPWGELSPEQKMFQARKMAVHAGMVHRMDVEIGRVLETVRRHGWAENTVVMFLSDNGASAEQIIRGDKHDASLPAGAAGTFLGLGPNWAAVANAPFRYHKSWVHEGGICTPFVVYWPAGITKGGALRRTPGHVIDVLPTVLALAGQDGGSVGQRPGSPGFPGRNLVPAFGRETMDLKRDYLWWYHDGNRALRVGDWKLVADHKNDWELYNLKRDRSEVRDLAGKYPDRVRDMAERWEAVVLRWGAAGR